MKNVWQPMITRTDIENDKTDNNIENDNVVIDIENADEVGQRMHLRDPEVAISNSNAAIMFLLLHLTALSNLERNKKRYLKKIKCSMQK